MSFKLRRCQHCGSRAMVTRVYKLHGPFRERYAIACSRCIQFSKPHVFLWQAVKEWNKDWK